MIGQLEQCEPRISNPGVVPDFGVHCSRTKARNNWSINKRKKGAASCAEVKVCDPSDAEKHIQIKWPGLSADDFSVEPASSKYMFYAKFKCPHDRFMTTKTVSVSCKAKKGKEKWILKGNPKAVPLKGCFSQRKIDLMIRRIGIDNIPFLNDE